MNDREQRLSARSRANRRPSASQRRERDRIEMDVAAISRIIDGVPQAVSA